MTFRAAWVLLLPPLLLAAACSDDQAASEADEPAPAVEGATPPEVAEAADDWPLPGRDYGNTRAVPESPIDRATVDQLEEQWQALERWAHELKGPGVLVLPQPLLKHGGSKTDKTLVDFKESDRLGAIFEHALSGDTGDGRPHDILILTGDMIGAEEAARIGLVDVVFDHDELRAKTLELAAKIASFSPLTVRMAKESMRMSERMSIEEGIVYERDVFSMLFSTEDMKEGVSAFLEKRQAEWKGR